MASTHKHHIVPRSKGGPDEEWNFVELDPYAHAYEHALDFVLFDHAPMFDFRHEAWPLLPELLREAVLEKRSKWASFFFKGKPRTQEVRSKISKSKTGLPNSREARQKMSLAKRGDKNPHHGKSRSDIFGNGGDTSKQVWVSYPDGHLKIFSSTKAAGKHLGCSPSSVAKWARKGHTPKVGKFVGYTFQYNQPEQ